MDDAARVDCACCGRTLPARRVAELCETPGTYVCTGCGLFLARRAGLPRLHRLVSRAARALARPHRTEHPAVASAIPILPSSDLERTEQYWQVLGFVRVGRYDGYLVTHADGVEVHFALQPEQEHRAQSMQPAPAAFVHVADVDALHARLEAAPVVGVGVPEDMPYGLRELVVRDPDGNRVRFGSPVG